MEPKDIATVPGLPEHVYDEAARQKQGSFVAANSQPDGYDPGLDQVSLTPRDWNPSGLDLSPSAGQSADNQSKPGEKYERGAKAAEYFEKSIRKQGCRPAHCRE
jgi:hypothetical protein